MEVRGRDARVIPGKKGPPFDLVLVGVMNRNKRKYSNESHSQPVNQQLNLPQYTAVTTLRGPQTGGWEERKSSTQPSSWNHQRSPQRNSYLQTINEALNAALTFKPSTKFSFHRITITDDDDDIITSDRDSSDSEDEKVTQAHPTRSTFVGLARARIKTVEALASSSALNTQTPSTPTHVFPQPNPMLNLPKMMLPTFDGNYQQWQSFHDFFISMIYDQLSVTKVVKLYHLRSALTGDAAKIIQSLEITDHNYDGAWKLISSHIGAEHSKTFIGRIQASSQNRTHPYQITEIKTHPGNEFKGSCRVRFQAHNTLLHSDEGAPDARGTAPPGTIKSVSNAAFVSALTSQSGYEALLGLAVINVLEQHGRSHTCRALLDSDSTSNFMSSRLSHDLQLRIHEQDIEIGGIGGTCTQSTYYTKARIGSRFNGYCAILNFLVMERVTRNLPVLTKTDRPWDTPPNLKLADPVYHAGGEVDIVIGIGLFWNLICVGQIRLGRGLPVLQQTKLGWIIAGDLSNVSGDPRAMCNLSLSRLDTQIEIFWHIEDFLNHHLILSSEEAR
ncbi:uncharacterized protein LOC117173558 [Belonocnema kinseyi]|uniref:uncharacterized protein LOC117173558 n=1 Tax=Belonocnema kinseyi TaxID=2817044 RepID=UPI00143D7C4C|nr:uncharacterized protein LOC117173558 [Belonocnema kinseyi]